MLTTEFNLDDFKEVTRLEALEEGRTEGIIEGERRGMDKGIERGIEKGMEKGQNHVLELMAQGLSYEEIKKKIEKPSKKSRK